MTSPYVSISYEQALEELFGVEADAICGEHRVVADAASRFKLIHQIAEPIRLAGGRLVQKARGDLSPDANLARFPVFVAPTSAPPKPRIPGRVTVAELFALEGLQRRQKGADDAPIWPLAPMARARSAGAELTSATLAGESVTA